MEPSEQAFTVEHSGNVQTVNGRTEAVRMAKELSHAEQSRVRVESEDGAVTMLFQSGSLEKLVTETPGRRRRTTTRSFDR